jgi:hypothetical protein
MDDLQFEYIVTRDQSVPEMTPVDASVSAEQAAEARDAKFIREAHAALKLPPEEDPFAWGTMREGQHIVDRQQEIARVASNRRSRAIAERDGEALSSGPDPFDADAQQQFEVAQRAAQKRMEQDTNVASGRSRQTAQPPMPTARRRGMDSQPQGAQRRNGGLPEFPTFQSAAPPAQPMLPGGKQYAHADNESFAQVQSEFDMATEKMLGSLAQHVMNATRRIEELERIIELRMWE